MSQPTVENISVWIWDKLYSKLKRNNCSLHEIEV
nr:6-carboxytetrahydropterin synthase [Clostridium sp. Marseille-Q2269]